MAIFFHFYWKGLITAPDLWYKFFKICFVLEPTEKKLIVEISLVSQHDTSLQWILRDITYYTFNTIYWQNISSKTNVCIRYTEIKHKTILWNKAHYANKTTCHKEANKCDRPKSDNRHAQPHKHHKKILI